MDIEKEVDQLIIEIRRLGTKEGETFGLTFAVLFNDERCQNLFEALMGTLRAAKRLKKIDYPGQLLLMGQHDSVFIKLLV